MATYGCAYDTVHGCAVDNVTARYKHFCGKGNLTVCYLVVDFIHVTARHSGLSHLFSESPEWYSCEQDANRETHMHDDEYFKGMVTCSMLSAKQGQT